MSNKWTSGPWRLEDLYLSSGDLEYIKLFSPWVEDPSWGDEESIASEAKANMQLMAAAPELYEALRILIIECGEAGKLGRAIDLLSKNTIDRANSALAKARGEAR